MNSLSEAGKAPAAPTSPATPAKTGLISPSLQQAKEQRETQPLPAVHLRHSLRIGSVPYLNAKPLTYALARR